MTKTTKPRRASFEIALVKGGKLAREGYVLGGFATHKESGTGEYFWKFTHLASGMSINVWPCHETKASALAHLELLAAGTAPQSAFVAAETARVPA